MILLSDAAKALDAKLLGNDLAFGAVTINGREDCTDALFVALKGENFDAHDYVQQASDAGASAALVSRPVEVDIPQLLVTDTQSAFTALAAWWRAKFSLPIVAITGSVGKTTVKQMLVSIASVEHETLGTHGNLNNEIGVPLTLMRLNSDHRFAVIELGMNHAGEISRLTRLVKPNVALLNNAAAAHLEGLGSLEAIAAAKGEIFEGLDADGTAVVNLDDSFAAYWMDLVGEHRVITFGLASHADVTADWQQHGNSISIRLKLSNRFVDFDMPGRGEHLVQNALAAAAAAHASGIGIDAIKTGLERFSAPSGRQQFHQVGDLTVIDDTYNANPRSVQSAIEVVAEYKNNLLVLGHMAELGPSADSLHADIGDFAAKHNVSQLLTCGPHGQSTLDGYLSSGGQQGQYFDTRQALSDFLKANSAMLAEYEAVLVKGSRSAKMEQIVTCIRDLMQETPAVHSTAYSTSMEASHVG